TELAIVDRSDPQTDRVTVVPTDLLIKAFTHKEVFDDAELPFTVRVLDYLQNSSTRFMQPDEASPATHGIGRLRVAEERPINTGVGAAQGVDVPALYLEIKSKSDQSDLGTYLVSPLLFEDSLEIGDKKYELTLRFKRIQKPYAVKLKDFRFDRYIGTETAKNFSSEVILIDEQQNVERTATISMNNPLRYYGDTLYQADWDKETEQATVLQVMTNSGWMIPYVSCMLVAIGMFAQFGSTFLRFSRRDVAPTQATTGMSFGELLAQRKSPTVWVPALVLLIFAGYVCGRARVPKLPATEMQLHQFGELPVAYNGRVKPLDTLARNALTILSGKGSLEVEEENPNWFRQLTGLKAKQPAVYWLLECVTESPESYEQRIFRIENLDVLQALDLKPRGGFRYSLNEVVGKTFDYVNSQGETEKMPEALRQAQLASAVPEGKANLAQVKFLELGSKLNAFAQLREAFSAPRIRFDSLEQAKADVLRVKAQIQRLRSGSPRPVPPATPSELWQTLLGAEHNAFVQRINGKEPDAATVALREVFDAYASDDVQQFNAKVAQYREIVEQRATEAEAYEAELAANGQVDRRKEAEKLRLQRVKFEAFFNHFNPFTKAMALYLVAFVLAGCSWLGWHTTLNRSANWLLWFTFVLHTYALICRIYISGRPPVTNLYSSAVFIGWAAVLFALVFERIYRFGIGNLLAALIGFPTLFVAYNLAGDGDTFQVLQAVLDTQFWLATHVVCITLGYSTTFLAGALGLAYVLMGHVANRLDKQQRQHLIRMTYGTLCFATFFSFVGTVLGGLWADDSWGRFWGWDPKENGALLIVTWNALVLHARWGAMVRQRGLATLAIFGNIVTAWSWFGTNQLGVGLHAYGFRKGMTMWLCVFVGSQLLVMLLGCLPSDWWRGKRGGEPITQEA
ncbi:MAG: cytochrome c biogenesis protein CcsA, partial [Bythopirellula sp.]